MRRGFSFSVRVLPYLYSLTSTLMKSLWSKVWSWYTDHTAVRHAVVVAIAYTIVHYATFLTSWAPSADQPFLVGFWTTVVAPMIRMVIMWAEQKLSTAN